MEKERKWMHCCESSNGEMSMGEKLYRERCMKEVSHKTKKWSEWKKKSLDS